MKVGKEEKEGKGGEKVEGKWKRRGKENPFFLSLEIRIQIV